MTSSKPKSWRDVLPIHPAAEKFPLMDADDQKALGDDIKKNGLREGVSILDGQLLDGRNRLDAMELVGIKLVTGNGHPDWDNIPHRNVKGVDPLVFVISKNLHRRHLKEEAKRQLIAELIKATPEKSNRGIAATVKVDHKTVASVRAEKEACGEIPHVETHTDSKGRKQQAHKTPTKIGITVKTPTKAALEKKRSDPSDLIAAFAAQVRADGFDLARRIGPLWPTFVERLREVADEIELEAERWEKAHELPTAAEADVAP